MTRLFILLYAGVLAVLFAAWYIHGEVWKRRAAADRARVFEEAHGGGARLVASELDAAPADDQGRMLGNLRTRFGYEIDVMPIDQLPDRVQRQIAGGGDVAYYSRSGKNEEEVVVAALANRREVVRLGPFPDFKLAEIERSLGGWMRLAADKIEQSSPGDRAAVVDQLQQRFDFPIAIARMHELPDWPKRRIGGGEVVVLYPQPANRWFSATPLSTDEVVRFGPLPSFERIQQKAATTTLALVLFPAALAIALMLRPIAGQLRRVENAAKAFAAGDLGGRVDERRSGSARPLAQAFNHMAGRTEALVRTQRELLQAVSHELRTPLSRMRFAIDLIETAKDDEERGQRLESLDASASELDELVSELLSYVRLETAEPRLEVEPIAVRETVEDLMPKYADLHPSIEFSMSDAVVERGICVSADRRGLNRVIGNLLSNASRFAKSKVSIDVKTDEVFTTIDIDDDGCGVPESDRQRVLLPFVRVSENGHQVPGSGVGLGLALVHRIVKQHGGRVEVLPSPAGGCRIRTTWPNPGGEAPS